MQGSPWHWDHEEDQTIVANLMGKTTVVLPKVLTKVNKLDVEDAQFRLQKIVHETLEPRVVGKADVGVDEEAKAFVEFHKLISMRSLGGLRGGEYQRRTCKYGPSST